jgi:6-pyruvoyltetrahydropterin/6-carboxytetrahydropterin synthase
MEITKRYHFYAAHRNKGAGEKCGRIHGHTYDVVCSFSFEGINESGVTVLFSEIDKLVEPIIKMHDHYLLLFENDYLCKVLQKQNEAFITLPFETSAENMAIYLFNRIKKETGLNIKKISLAETKTSIVAYEP